MSRLNPKGLIRKMAFFPNSVQQPNGCTPVITLPCTTCQGDCFVPKRRAKRPPNAKALLRKLGSWPLPTVRQGGCNVDCQDPYSVLLHTLLELGSEQGSTATEILEGIPLVCPDAEWTLPLVETYLQLALKRGLVRRYTDTTYVVNTNMLNVNLANRQYFCLCQLYVGGGAPRAVHTLPRFKCPQQVGEGSSEVDDPWNILE